MSCFQDENLRLAKYKRDEYVTAQDAKLSGEKALSEFCLPGLSQR
jgi:hypothetical protein